MPFTTQVNPIEARSACWIRKRLKHLSDWREIAHLSDYKPGKLAHNFGITLRQLERYFDQEFGIPPRSWLRTKRMEAAKTLLEDSQSVKSVAYQLGYKQESHFSKEFKNYYGEPPSRFLRSRRSALTAD